MQRFRTAVQAIAALFFIAVGASPLEGATVRRLELDQVRARAESVFAGQVVGVSVRPGGDGKMVWTDYRIEVSDTFSGADPGRFTTLSFGGGTAGSLSIGIPGMPELREGDHYVFFVEPRPDPANPPLMPTVGWGQGLYRIVRNDDGNGTRTALVSADGEPLELSQDGRLTRGSLVNIADDRIVEVQPALRDGVGTRMRPTHFESPDGTVTPLPATPRPEAGNVRTARSFATLDDLRLFAQGRLEAVPSRTR